MVAITLITPLPDGRTEERRLDAQPGLSVMQAAVEANVPGIAADCGGLLTCATCHVHVRAEWLDRLPPLSDDEATMLAFTASPRQPNSRLSCQLVLSEALDGLVVELPPTQY